MDKTHLTPFIVKNLYDIYPVKILSRFIPHFNRVTKVRIIGSKTRGKDMVRLKVKELAGERGISLSKLSRLADGSYKTVQLMYRDPSHGFNTKTLEGLPTALVSS